MRKLTILFTAMALLFAGCHKPELVDHVTENLSFEATVEDFDIQTKTSLAPGNYVVWSSGDCLAIFQGSSIADEYILAEGSAGLNSGSFRWVADNNTVNGDFSAGTELPCNVAFYPYSADLTLTGDMEGNKTAYVLSNVVLPATQVYSANSFGNGAFPMVAVTENMEDHNLKFKNVLGAMKLQLKGSMAVKSIKIEGANGEILSGAANVTAYTNNLTPAITMTGADQASKSVTLDCGDGVLLNEAVATNFYISLPPVLFQNGFTVIVTDVEDKEYTIAATDANTILRSAILVMPEVVIVESGEGFPEEDEEELVIPVLSVTLNSTSLKLYEDDSVQLEATVRPADATNKTVVWTSSDATIATVDQTGLVTAVSVGTVEIYAQAGDVVATCSVEVNDKLMAKDYIDEYGINHGKGTLIGTVVWAPVNCGYHVTDYQWGKLYQWGRKYGQGYEGNLCDGDNIIIGSVSDATTPEFSESGVSLQGGQSANNKNVFFIGSGDWLYQRENHLWNSGTEGSPVKTEYDPCPEGWRVPTYAELEELSQNHSSWTTNEAGQTGYWFSGLSSYSSEVDQVFFPAAGCRGYSKGKAFDRGYDGDYWSSKSFVDYLERSLAGHLIFGSGYAYMYDYYDRAYGYSVRCVQE